VSDVFVMSQKLLKSKFNTLYQILEDMGTVVLAYSGGVDSTFLLKAASEILRDRVLAVTAISPTYTQNEYERACGLAQSFGVRHITIETDELEDPRFCENPPNRCYYCKMGLFRKLRGIADREGIEFIVDASNLDDCSDHRPGMIAAEEVGIRSPLIEAQLTKEEIRALSRRMNLPTWDLPSMACLASRFPYGETITPEKIKRVDQAEDFLRDLGFKEIRVRSHGHLARIEVARDRVRELSETKLRKKIVKELKSFGFAYVALDLEGYRTGSMNEILATEKKACGRGSRGGGNKGSGERTAP